tara:strand:+ start:309 stop:953 length:645 start_codon:yes stop_codon:yes gene_type:complete
MMSGKHLVLGSTGLVGSRLIYHLSKNNLETIALTRRKIENLPYNISELIIDFDLSLKKNSFPMCEHLYICMGTTIKTAGSKEGFKKVDLDYCVDIAQRAKKNGVTQISIVSSIGANDASKNFYLKIKGMLIKKILIMGFHTVNIYLPGLLIGKRNEKRFLESIGQKISPIINLLLVGKMKKYRSIKADFIAAHMIKSKMKGVNYFYYEDFINER